MAILHGSLLHRLAIVLCFAQGVPAAAQEIASRIYAGVSLRLPIPQGYCVMERDDPIAKPYYIRQDSGNQGRSVVAVLFAACDEWSKRRDASFLRPKRYGAYLFALVDGKEQLAPKSSTLASFVKATSTDSELAEFHKRAGIEMLDTDGSAVYLGFKTPNSYPKVKSVLAQTLVRQVAIGLTLSEEYENNSFLTQMTLAQRDNAKALVTANH